MLNYSDEELNSIEMHNAIAVRLHNERINANLSLDKLAEITGYSKPTVQSWEKGWNKNTGENRIPTLEQLIDLCSIYNCTPEYLLCEYDCKTKQITDISFETGLQPQSIKKLHNMFTSLLENPFGGGANNLFLGFLNHYISNMDAINEFIFNRQTLELVKNEFEEEEYKKDILEGYEYVNTIHPEFLLNDLIFRDGIFPPHKASMNYTEPLLEYYESKGYDVETIKTIMGKFTYYFDVLSSSKLKQSDFALSDCFLDIIKSFFNSFPDNIYSEGGYDDFVDLQRTNLPPDRIKPINIVR